MIQASTSHPASPQMPQNPAPAQQPPAKKTGKRKLSWKALGTIIGLSLFFIGTMVTVLIVQRQQMADAPPAPTAPSSRPSAAVPEQGACTLQFTIEEDVPAGSATCVRKEAADASLMQPRIFPTPPRTVYEPGAQLPVGSEIFYAIYLDASETTAGAVTVTDVLPNGIEFVESTMGNGTHSNGRVTFTVPAFSGESRLEFKARVTDEATGTLTNNVTVATAGGASSRCAVSHTVPAPGTISCTAKEAYTNYTTVRTDTGEEIPAESAIKAGETFVYSITVKATAPTTQDAVITDELPDGIEFADTATSTLSYNTSTRTVTYTLGKFTADELTKKAEFKVKAAADIAVGKFSNTASVNFAGQTTGAKTCSVAHNVPPRGTATCDEKVALTTFSAAGGKKMSGEVKPGDTFVYQVKISADEETTSSVQFVDTLPAGVEYVADQNNTAGLSVNTSTRTVSLDLGTLASSTNNKTATVEFKVRVRDNAAGTLKNSAEITTGTTKDVCTQTLTIPGETTPDRAACNESCSSNSDCANSNHICATTSDGSNRCRLATNVGSNTCTAPGAPAPTPTPGVTPSPIATQPQPVLPEELPQSGPEDWGNWLKAGLVTLGIGAVLLLLL